MSRSVQKGNPCSNHAQFLSSYISSLHCGTFTRRESYKIFGIWDRPHRQLFLKFYRRNLLLTHNIVTLLNASQLTILVYNGYDFFPKIFLRQRYTRYGPLLNLSGLVSCKTLNVRHRVKSTKQSRSTMKKLKK